MPGTFPRFTRSSTRIVTEAAALARLEQLGLPGQAVRDSVEFGAGRARAAMLADYPRTFPGYLMWAETGAALVSLAREHGWEREYCRGVEPLVNRSVGVAILVTAGDGATGQEGYEPQPRYDRQELVQHVVNGGLNSLLAPPRDDWTVWFLLHNLNVPLGTVAPVPAELSRPTAIDPNTQNVVGWAERILIPSSGGGGVNAARRGDTGPQEPSVRVRRRVS